MMLVLTVTSECSGRDPFVMQRFYGDRSVAIADFRKMVRSIPEFSGFSDSTIGTIENGYSRNFGRFWFSISEIPSASPIYGKNEDEEDFGFLRFTKDAENKMTGDIAENMKENNQYVFENLEPFELERRDRAARVDESRFSDWQCPRCKHRVINNQIREIDGMEAWGCSKFCDTHNSRYFNGHSCKLFEEGDCWLVWP